MSPALNISSAAAGVRRPDHRGRLFRRYLLLILSLVTIALLASGVSSVYFTYKENKAALSELQHEKALSAASRIEQYIVQIEQQLAFAALPQLDSIDVESRRTELLKLLRRAPEITDIALIGADGREQLLVSRLGMDSIGSARSRVDEPVFRNARRGKPWFGPVYFRKETEPYMTIGVRNGDETGPVTVADVNLKFVWDVVSRIKIGDKGKAYVVDSNGFLIADPDIGLVLRKTNLSNLPHVRAAMAKTAASDLAEVSKDLHGSDVLTSLAPIETLHWNVFVEQPADEVYDKLHASIVRTALLLLAGLGLSALGALALARGMARPIRTLEQGAERFGAGNLDHRIEIRTGDELETLADRFNTMAGQLRESYAGLERKVAERTAELKSALDQQTAISEILRVISSSPGDVKPMLNAVAQRALELCNAAQSTIMLVDGDVLRFAAGVGSTRTFTEDETLELSRGSVTGRCVIDRTVVHMQDLSQAPDSEFPVGREIQRRIGHRAVLSVPLMRETRAIGAIALWRMEAKDFTDKQIALVKTFADQAAIAIENVRLFNETRESLSQQTAIAEILRVIASSPTDVQPVLDAIAERAARLCDASAAAMYLTDGKTLRQLASRGPAAEPVENVMTLPVDGNSVSGRAVLERRTMHIPDMLAEASAYPLSAELAQRYGHRTVVVVPLFRDGQPFGTILLRRQEVRGFTEREVALLQTFGDQAAIALENIRLFNETKEALEQQRASGEVLAAISSSIADTTPVFETILSRCERLFGGKAAVIDLIGEDGRVHLGAYHGPRQDDVKRLYPHPLDTRSATGTALASRSIVHYSSLDDAPVMTRDAFGVSGIKAAIGAPMTWEGKGIGAVWVARDHAGPFSESEIALLKTFADQAVIAIQNARLFHEIQDKSRQLEIANKHKSEFLANMSHELRTPLNAIIGFSEALLERYFGELNPKQDDYLRDIHSSGFHLLSLINDILDLSKVEAGRMELEPSTFELASAVSNATTLVRERAQRHGIALGQQVDTALGDIQADERKFKQILLNLLSNAVKFTPDGGRIDVTARRENSEAVIAVRDTGIGIAPEDHAAVFEEFRQIGGDYTRKQEGSGLGLALARKFVELHGGRIWLDSEAGKGSTFTFTIPIER